MLSALHKFISAERINPRQIKYTYTQNEYKLERLFTGAQILWVYRCRSRGASLQYEECFIITAPKTRPFYQHHKRKNLNLGASVTQDLWRICAISATCIISLGELQTWMQGQQPNIETKLQMENQQNKQDKIFQCNRMYGDNNKAQTSKEGISSISSQAWLGESS